MSDNRIPEHVTAEFKLMQEVLTFYKEHANVSESDDYWRNLIRDADDFAMTHGNELHATNLITECVWQLDRVLRGVNGFMKAGDNDWPG